LTPKELNSGVSFDGQHGQLWIYGAGQVDAGLFHNDLEAQGLEYLAIVIPVLTQHSPMLQRNLLYTGVTRGKRLVVLVGQRKAIGIAVRNVSGRRRWSKLSEWLRRLPAAITDPVA